MSKYRLDESFEIIGGFWVFGQEDKKFTGTLSSRKGLVEIQTSPTYSELDDAALRASMLELSGTTDIQQISAICGFTTDKRCTLLNSVILDGGGLTDFSSRRQVQRKLYRAMGTVMGLHLESSEAMSIDGAAYYFTNIQHLLPAPWSSQMADQSTTHVVPWKAKEIFRFTSDELCAEVACEVFAGGTAKARTAVSIKSVPVVRITPQSLQSVDWFTSLAFRLENFFTLFLGTSVGLQRVQLFQGDDDGWVVQRMRRRKEKVNFQTWVRCPFPNVADALVRWLRVPPDRQLVELNMLSMMRKSDVFSETEFLTLAQTLEGFGRIRLGDRPGEGCDTAACLYGLIVLAVSRAARQRSRSDGERRGKCLRRLRSSTAGLQQDCKENETSPRDCGIQKRFHRASFLPRFYPTNQKRLGVGPHV